MKLAVLGATGRAGSRNIKEALVHREAPNAAVS